MGCRRWVGAAVAAVALALVGLGQAAAAEDPNHCVATNGVVRVQQGTATCETSEGKGVVAIAKGEGSSASNTCDFSQAKAFGASTRAVILTFPGTSCDHNAATSTGFQSRADVSGTGGAGNRNTAIASGDRSEAGVGNSVESTAIASGDGSSAGILNSVTSTATASGADSAANVGIDTTDSTATASGDRSAAFAGSGRPSTATASGDDSLARADFGATAEASGHGSTAFASGDGSTAIAATDGCTAIAFNGQTVTC